MITRCKMKCERSSEGSETSELVFRTVYDPNPESENGKFFKYTPSGNLTLQVVNPDVARQFIVGNEYYIDIIPA